MLKNRKGMNGKAVESVLETEDHQETWTWGIVEKDEIKEIGKEKCVRRKQKKWCIFALTVYKPLFKGKLHKNPDHCSWSLLMTTFSTGKRKTFRFVRLTIVHWLQVKLRRSSIGLDTLWDVVNKTTVLEPRPKICPRLSSDGRLGQPKILLRIPRRQPSVWLYTAPTVTCVCRPPKTAHIGRKYKSIMSCHPEVGMQCYRWQLLWKPKQGEISYLFATTVGIVCFVFKWQWCSTPPCPPSPIKSLCRPCLRQRRRKRQRKKGLVCWCQSEV